MNFGSSLRDASSQANWFDPQMGKILILENLENELKKCTTAGCCGLVAQKSLPLCLTLQSRRSNINDNCAGVLKQKRLNCLNRVTLLN